jgi:hypothetical protein
MDFPCITVGELKAKLAGMPDEAKVFAWAPGSYMPVACAVFSKDRALLEINVPIGCALDR